MTSLEQLPGSLYLGWGNRFSALAAVVLALAVPLLRPRAALAAALGLLVVNRRFYALLLRRGGPTLLVGGYFLHVLHLLSAVAAVPPGLWRGLRKRRGARAV